MDERLIGALIGLARATDGNEHLINSDSTSLIIECLSSEGNLETMLGRVEEEKKKMVPDCFCCANPCGRTDTFDMNKLLDEDVVVRQLKLGILSGISRLAKTRSAIDNEKLFYKALIIVGIVEISHETLVDITRETENAAQTKES